jgi:Protein of unknown function (DUF1569)
MTSIYNPEDNQKIIDRINKLTPENQAQWGKMNVAQMISHCEAPIDVAFGNLDLKANFFMQLLGKMLKKKILNSTEFKKDSPTAPEFIRKNECDFEIAKANLISKINKFSEFGEKAIKTTKHPFFGEMTLQDWDKLHVMHLDHHLKQFGV